MVWTSALIYEDISIFSILTLDLQISYQINQQVKTSNFLLYLSCWQKVTLTKWTKCWFRYSSHDWDSEMRRPVSNVLTNCFCLKYYLTWGCYSLIINWFNLILHWALTTSSAKVLVLLENNLHQEGSKPFELSHEAEKSIVYSCNILQPSCICGYTALGSRPFLLSLMMSWHIEHNSHGFPLDPFSNEVTHNHSALPFMGEDHFEPFG